MKKYFINLIFSTTIWVICLNAPLCLYADIIGRYGNEFYSSSASARTLGMGGANVALSDDIWALFWNPAGLVEIKHTQIGLMHSERFAGTVDYDAAGFAQTQSDGSVFAFGILRLGVNGIPFTRLENPTQPLSGDNRVEIDKFVNEGEYAFYAAKAGESKIKLSRFSLNLGWGIAPKLIFKHIGNYRAYGLGMDLGLNYTTDLGIPLKFGLSIKDLLGTVVGWEQTGHKEIYPSTARLGIAVPVRLPQLEAVLTPVIDYVYRFDLISDPDASSFHYGAEYTVRNTVAIRAGYDDDKLTLGGGLCMRAINIDYAFINHSELGGSHRISLTIKWNK